MQFPHASVQPVPSKTGLLKRIVRFGDWTIALKRAGAPRPERGEGKTTSYSLTGSRSKVDFLFFQLPDDAFVLLPSALLPRSGTTFLDATGSRYYPFKNVFAMPLSLKRVTVAGERTTSALSRARHEPSGTQTIETNRQGEAWCHCNKV